MRHTQYDRPSRQQWASFVQVYKMLYNPQQIELLELSFAVQLLRHCWLADRRQASIPD